jgi:phosphatidylserine/phosphatidylglycerophosphate/cardiolipin synthase-like enzyme
MRKSLLAATALAAIALVHGCKTTGHSAVLADGDGASAPPSLVDVGVPFNHVDAATVELGNKASLDAKLAAIQGAQSRIDMAYFIWGFDDTSAAVEEALLAKAAAGVKIRILVDGLMALPNLAMLEMLVAEGKGNIQIAKFRPVPDEVWQDLASWGFADRGAFGDAAAGFSVSKVYDLLMQNENLKNNPAFKSLVGLFLPTEGGGAGLLPTLQNLPGLTGAASTLASFSPDQLIQQAGAALAGAGDLMFHPVQWSTLLKRFHHKLLVVDGSFVQGGGRNIENPYHWETDFRQLRPAGDKYVFMDADFHLDSPAVAALALRTQDLYWQCLSDYARCQPKVRLEAVTPRDGVDYAAMHARITELAAGYQRAVQAYSDGGGVSAAVAQQGTFAGQDLNVAYIENRMFPRFRGAENTLLGQEESQYNGAWAKLMEGAKAGESIVIQNAYLFFPTDLQVALAHAVQKCVKVTILTNSTSSSEQGFISVVARPQYSYFLRIGREAAGRCGGGGDNYVEIYEYGTTDESLHAKIAVVGDYVLVGSTNADPRSDYTDTQNGVIIGPGAGGNQIARDVRQWLLSRPTTPRQSPEGGAAPVVTKLSEADVNAQIPKFEDVTDPAKVATMKPQDVLLGYVAKMAQLAYESEDRGAYAMRGVLSLIFISL